ncbi:MAG: hypothetical protein ACLGHP_08665, partial [Vicinamibacteria bacterium]
MTCPIFALSRKRSREAKARRAAEPGRPGRRVRVVFTDDALAESVAPGGRLDRALSVVERRPGNQPAAGAPAPAALPVT